MNPRLLLLGAVAVVAFGLGAIFTLRSGAPGPADPDGPGYVLDEPRPLPAFTLVDDAGTPFASGDFQGHWSLLYFGFTYCPDVCPSALSVMAQVKAQLDAQEGLDDRYYLVSVDPERDSPERLREYVRYFDPEFRGLTGTFDQLDVLTLAAGAVYRVPEEPEDENYLVAHSSTFTLVDPRGRIHAIFTSPFEPGPIADRLTRIMNATPGP